MRMAKMFKNLTIGRFKAGLGGKRIMGPANTANLVKVPSAEHLPRSRSWNVDDRGHYQQDVSISGINLDMSPGNLPHNPPEGNSCRSADVKNAGPVERQDLAGTGPLIEVQLVDQPYTGQVSSAQEPLICASPVSTLSLGEVEKTVGNK